MSAAYIFADETKGVSISGQTNASSGEFAMITPDNVAMVTTGNNTTLIAEGAFGPGHADSLNGYGVHDVLATNGATNLVFGDFATNIVDLIDATAASRNFADVVTHFGATDTLLLVGGAAANVSFSDTGNASFGAEMRSAVSGGLVFFPGLTAVQLQAHTVHGTGVGGIPFVAIHAV